MERPTQLRPVIVYGVVAVFLLGSVITVVAILGLPVLNSPSTETESGAGTPAESPASATDSTAQDGSQAESVTVAFVADTGLNDESRAVLELIASEDADLVVHSGDFDYNRDPAAWDAMLNETLGPDFPVVATMGNHDVYTWTGYERAIEGRTNRAENLSCTGDVGLHATCRYEGITIVQSSDELCSVPSGDDEEYPAACGNYSTYEPEADVQTQLAQSNTTWNICSWHLPSNSYQVGEKEGVPLSMYDACRSGGADLIATGDNHAYARTYPMSSFEQHTVASRSSPYTLGDGATMAVVTGASGYSFYETTDRVNEPWWAATHTNGSYGAFFCTLRSDGTGECYFKTIDGEVVDGGVEIQSASANRSTNESIVG